MSLLLRFKGLFGQIGSPRQERSSRDWARQRWFETGRI